MGLVGEPRADRDRGQRAIRVEELAAGPLDAESAYVLADGASQMAPEDSRRVDRMDARRFGQVRHPDRLAAARVDLCTHGFEPLGWIVAFVCRRTTQNRNLDYGMPAHRAS